MRKLLQLLAIVLVSKAKAEATEIVAQAQEKAKGLGVKMSGWFSGLAGGWHEPSAKAKAEATKVKAEAQKAQEEAQKALEDAEKVKAKAKKEADQRVATVANQLTEERTKTKDLEEELRKAQEQANDLAKRLALYEDPTKGTDHNGGGKFKKWGGWLPCKIWYNQIIHTKEKKNGSWTWSYGSEIATRSKKRIW